MVWDGGVAQLGERLPCTQEVIGSIPFTSTRGSVTRGDLPEGSRIGGEFWAKRRVRFGGSLTVT